MIVGAAQPTAGNFELPTEPATSRPVMLVHGTKDPIVPYQGGTASLWGFRPRGEGLSAEDTARYYARRNGLHVSPVRSELPHDPRSGRTSVTRSEYRADGKDPVVLFTVTGGGHTVPGPKSFPRIMGRTNHDLDTALAAADFFRLG